MNPLVSRFFTLQLLPLILSSAALGQDAAQPDEKKPLAFSADVATVTKYLWRGQRLTDGWSLQPSGTLQVGQLSFNVWGNLDLVAVNEGDALPLMDNQLITPDSGTNGLQGKFSEVDYTISYSLPIKSASIDVGSVIYTFPGRSASLPSTAEIYGSLSFGSAPLSPRATLNVDVDETVERSSAGLYFLVGGGHTILLHLNRLPALELTGSVAFVNSGFSQYYYRYEDSGLHDFRFDVSAPIAIGERVSAALFIAYSGLLGEFRNHQFQNPRDLYRGTAGSPATYADSVWGGINFSFAF